MTTALPPQSKADKAMPVLASVLGVAHLVFGATKLVAVPMLVAEHSQPIFSPGEQTESSPVVELSVPQPMARTRASESSVRVMS